MDMNNFLDEKACDIDTNFDERVRACSNLALRLAFGVRAIGIWCATVASLPAWVIGILTGKSSLPNEPCR